MATLYRQYRPQKFTEVIDQTPIKTTLKNEIITEQISNAYLFCGPRAVGKTTLARIFAKALNCKNKEEGEPCNECEACLNIQNNQSLNVIEVDAASHTGVDNVRENIISSAQVPPTGDYYKVFIIDEVHMLSVSAFNALLKIIEEPPQGVVFIFCTTEVHKVPSTIISRCQRFDFKRISTSDIVKKLSYITSQEKIEVDKEVLELVARQANGYMRDAESLLGQIITISGKKITTEEASLVIPNNDLKQITELIEYLVDKNSVKAIQLINTLINNGVDIRSFLKTSIELLRKMMLDKINPGLGEKLGLDFGKKTELKISEILQKTELETLTNFIEKLQEALIKTKNANIIQLPLELKVVELCNTNKQTRVENINKDINNTKKSEEKVSTPTNKESTNTNKEESEPSVLTFKQIEKKWNKFILEIKKNHHSISFILQSCQPTELKDDKLILSFKYKFHKERLTDSNIKQTIEETLKQIYQEPIKVEGQLDENLSLKKTKTKEKNSNNSEKANSDNKGMINNLLNTLGGRVVN